MDNTLEDKSQIHANEGKPKKSGVMEQALALLDGTLSLEYEREPWWSLLIFWIQELRWRRVFWEKMGRPPEPEIKQ